MFSLFSKSRVCALVALALAWGVPSTAQNANDSAACQTIDRVWETVSVIRQLDGTQNARTNQRDLRRIQSLLPQISATTLGDASQAQPISRFVTQIETALTSTETQLSLSSNVKQVVSTAFLRDVQSLDAYWNCRRSEAAVDSAGDFEVPATTRNDTGVLDDATADDKNIIAGMSEANGLSPNSRVLKNSKVGRDIDFELTPPLFFIAFLAFCLGITLYLRKRSKGFRSRQKRRILQTPILAQLGKKNFAMTLVDISMNGGKVQHSGEIEKQKTIKLEINGRWYAGKIIWTNEAFAGVSFKKPLKSSIFNAAVSAALGEKAPA